MSEPKEHETFKDDLHLFYDMPNVPNRVMDELEQIQTASRLLTEYYSQGSFDGES